jgi:putative glutamine amidotransferase
LPAKKVSFVEGTRLHEIFGRETLRVNSVHRQAVDKLGHGLRVAARDEFRVVQAIEDPGARFRMGVQWHPEFLIYKASSRKLFSAFIAAVRAAKVERRGVGATAVPC